MEIRKFRHSDLGDVLALLKRSDNTSRSETTWLENQMTGMLAFEKSKLIGAIPLEPRTLMIGEGQNIKSLWVSGAHVDPEYRRQGIGSKLVSQVEENFVEYHGIFAYRPDENSPAFKWYSRLGFQVLLPIVSFKKKRFATRKFPVL